MYKYHKIEVPFERSTKTKRLDNGIFISPEIEYLKDNKWLCTEKINGTNIGVVWDGYKVSFQGRTEDANIPKPLQKALDEMFLSEGMDGLFEQIFGDGTFILFGEGYGKGVNGEGVKYRDDASFILFDVYYPKSDLYLQRPSVEDIAKKLGIDVVPIIGTYTLDEAIEFIKTRPKSTIGEAEMEGLVCTPTVNLKDRQGKRIMTKVKVKDFLPKIPRWLRNQNQPQKSSEATPKTVETTEPAQV